MYALSEAPKVVSRRRRRASSAACRVTSTGRPLAPALARPAPPPPEPTRRLPPTRPHPSAAVFRRRRIAVAVLTLVAVALVAVSIVAAAAGGAAGRAVLERLVGLGVVALWASCAVALWRCTRSPAAAGRPVAAISGVEPGASCLAPGSASVLSARSAS